MADKDAAILELEEAYVAFRDLISGLPDEAFGEQFNDGWTLTQLLAHMAGWYREMTPAFGRVGRGERPVPAGVDYSDADGWNARFAKDARTGRGALDDFDLAFHGYYAAAKELSDEHFGLDPERGRPRIGNRLLGASGIEHLHEHQPQVEVWVAQRR